MNAVTFCMTHDRGTAIDILNRTRSQILNGEITVEPYKSIPIPFENGSCVLFAAKDKECAIEGIDNSILRILGDEDWLLEPNNAMIIMTTLC